MREEKDIAAARSPATPGKMEPCSHCRSIRIAFRKKRGTVGTAVQTTFYQETVECKNCNISVSARTPGNAVKLWNRSWYAIHDRKWQPIKTAKKNSDTVLLFPSEHGKVFAGYWNDGSGSWSMIGVLDYDPQEPTHWMPYTEASSTSKRA